MNTVLDDNKKLCLNSGEIIAMSKSMSLIFEPMDLLAASPATVSRCGMIYLEPASIGHQILIHSWKAQNPWLPKDVLKMLEECFEMIDEIYGFMKQMKTICFVSIFGLLQTFFKLVDHEIVKIQKYVENFYEEWLVVEEKYKLNLLNGLFIFAIVWSFGACVDTSSRKLFDQSFKKLITGDITQGKKKKTISFPEKLTLFDYLFQIKEDKLTYEWIKWIDTID